MNYTHLASRLFGTPLLIERAKLDAIMAVLGPRLGIVSEDEAADASEKKAYGPGDKGKERKSYFVTEDGIAVIDIVGPLVKRSSGNFLSGGPTTYGEIENEFVDAATDPAINGILLCVDSPGGESVGAFELSDLIHSQRGSKPIFAAADGDAFSAAYALASAADQLYLTKSGGVGSIGVWMMHVDQSEANKAEGVKPTFIFAGARKLDGNPHAPLTDEARGVFQAEVDRIYGMFVDTVARNRGMDAKSVRNTEAGLFFGESALNSGLADKIGTVNDAIAGLRSAITKKVSGVAVSAAPRSTREVSNMEPNEPHADAPQAPVEQLVAPPAAQASAGLSAEMAYAIEVTELCSIAGMPAMASGFMKKATPLEDVRKELQSARVAADAESAIFTGVLPDTGASLSRGVGTSKYKPGETPIERAAESLANARKEK